MKLVRWIFTWELAIVHGVSGHPTAHAYVAGSSAPICFRSKAKEAHPDHGGSTEAFQRIKSAFDAAHQHFARAS
jgi:hypothetical protein